VRPDYCQGIHNDIRLPREFAANFRGDVISKRQALTVTVLFRDEFTWPSKGRAET
jgi:hypothetical protein